jgi:hypothetical protein
LSQGLGTDPSDVQSTALANWAPPVPEPGLEDAAPFKETARTHLGPTVPFEYPGMGGKRESHPCAQPSVPAERREWTSLPSSPLRLASATPSGAERLHLGPDGFLGSLAPGGHRRQRVRGSQASPSEEMPRGLSLQSADARVQTWRASRPRPKGPELLPRGGAIPLIRGPGGCRVVPGSRTWPRPGLSRNQPESWGKLKGEPDPRRQRWATQWNPPTLLGAVPRSAGPFVRTNFAAEKRRRR